MVDHKDMSQYNGDEAASDSAPGDVFGDEAGHDIKYKTLSWQMVAGLMCSEIVTNGMLALPYSIAAVGLVPGIICIVFLGIFALYTSYLLIEFKLRHPEVHTMGDAGFILFGPIGREVLAAGTLIFLIFGLGGQLLAGQIALASLSDQKLCNVLYAGIITIATVVCSIPRTLDNIKTLGVASVTTFTVAATVAMVGAGLYPTPDRVVVATKETDFYTAFFAITNPVYAYAGHVLFFLIISEMKKPQDAMKSAVTLQTFATILYTVFAVVTYVFIGEAVASPSFLSLEIRWQKAAFGISLLNFIIAGALYAHTAAKLLFVRLFRHSRHLHSHSVTGWTTWVFLIVLVNGAAFVLAVGIPIFNFLIGIAASLFAAWYTYGLAGFFLFHMLYHDGQGYREWARKWLQSSVAVLTIALGAFICVAGTYVTIRGIHDAYAAGTLLPPFSC